MGRLACFLVTAFGVLAACGGDIKVLRVPHRSWGQAREACREQGKMGSCDLATKTRLHEEWSKLGLLGSDSYWVGGQRLFQWLWDEGNGGERHRLYQDHGCYKLTVDRLDSLQYNGPQQCHNACETEAFVYLQGNKCRCSDALEGEQVSRDLCDLSCDMSDDKCGARNDYFSVYSVPEPIEFIDVDETFNCAVGRLKDNKLHVQSAECGRYHHYFCLSDKQSSDVALRTQTFEAAVSRCRNRHDSSLPSLTSSSPQAGRQLVADLQALSAKVSGGWTTDQAFWMPLQRRVRAVWVDGQRGEEGGQFGTCLAATARTASYRLTDLPCSESHGALCDCSGGTRTSTDDQNNDSTGDKETWAKQSGSRRCRHHRHTGHRLSCYRRHPAKKTPGAENRGHVPRALGRDEQPCVQRSRDAGRSGGRESH
ncbi:uncharacterized protein LOC143283372 isoform X2 [Babylonia areolata]|uniref:uncharacterized protein LOC143283372 isoform X2 n=1 Tax=Babylonia areolata TaxID=304850 RepID=UPI003FD2BEBA